MTLQSSGQISLSDVQTEFGGSNPISISEYYGVGSGSSSISLGLTPALFTVSGNNASWTSRSVDISAYEGCAVRPVFLHTNMSAFTADLQLDQIGFGTNLQSFESASSVGSWQTTLRSTATYASATFQGLNTGGLTGAWNRDSGGTPSSNTGLTSAANGTWYLYTEVTSYFSSTYRYYLRDASSTTITSSNNTLNFSEARYGAGMGTLTVHLEVTSLPPSGAPSSGMISLSDFYGLQGATDLSGTSAIFQTFYPIVGYGNGFTYNSATRTGGTLSPIAIPGTSQNIVGVIGYSNPGFQGVYLYTDGTSNSGWTTVTISSDNGFRTYTANRANLSFTLASSIGGTNSGYGGFWTLNTQGSTPGYYAFEAVNGIGTPAQSGNAFTIVFS